MNLPLVLLGLFWASDIAANFRLIPGATVSELVWTGGWPARIVTACLLLVLTSHILFQWPYGPKRVIP